MKIKRLSASDAPAYRLLRLEGLKECPAAFGSSFEEEKKKGLALYRERLTPSPDRWVYGFVDKGRLVATATLMRDGHLKSRHKAAIYAMYVAPQFRRIGLGRKLMEHCIARARSMRGLAKLGIAVVESNEAAVRLYKRLGFSVYAREPDALRVAGASYPELFLSLPVGR